eukprot:scaffold349520_cov182-Cyclotella_meneghiniana.AAC.1
MPIISEELIIHILSYVNDDLPDEWRQSKKNYGEAVPTHQKKINSSTFCKKTIDSCNRDIL